MRIPVVAALIGELLLYFAAAFGPPLVMALGDGNYRSATGFAVAMGISLALGTAAHTAFRRWRDIRLHRFEALATVSMTWATLGFVASIPYHFYGLSWTDGLFETISGLTTTGATILVDFGAYDRAFFLWRAMTQWFGGLGVIALFVVVLPRLGIAGRQLFFAEASDASGENLRPQVRQAAARLWLLYVGLTAACTLGLALSGMSAYDAVCHAFATLAAGGFSPNALSIAGYDNPAAEWVLIVFMLLAGSSFTLLYRTLTSKPSAPLYDVEFKAFWGVAIAGGLLLAWSHAGSLGADSVRTGLFQAASLISSTGFASTDYNLWDDRSKAIIVVIMLVNGCAGSAAGGPKVVRLLIFAKYIAQSITRTLHPDAILPYKWQGSVMSGRVMRSIIALVVLYFVGYGVIGALVVVQGVELETGFVAAIACLGNIGPAFGIAGPMGSYAEFPDGVKLTLTAAMWIGRLEIVTVLVLFHPDFLRTIRWRDRAPTMRVKPLRETSRDRILREAPNIEIDGSLRDPSVAPGSNGIESGYTRRLRLERQNLEATARLAVPIGRDTPPDDTDDSDDTGPPDAYDAEVDSLPIDDD